LLYSAFSGLRMFNCCCSNDDQGQEVGHVSGVDLLSQDSVHPMTVHPRVMSRRDSREAPAGKTVEKVSWIAERVNSRRESRQAPAAAKMVEVAVVSEPVALPVIFRRESREMFATAKTVPVVSVVSRPMISCRESRGALASARTIDEVSNVKTPQKESFMKQMAMTFLKRAEAGIAIQLLMPTKSGGMWYIFQVNEKLQTGCLRPVAGLQTAGMEHRFMLNDLHMVHKGADIVQMMPQITAALERSALGAGLSTCVLISTHRGGQEFVLQFTTEEEAQHFFTCMTFLRLSVNIAAERSPTTKGP